MNISVRSGGPVDRVVSAASGTRLGRKPAAGPDNLAASMRFCDSRITCRQIKDELHRQPFKNIKDPNLQNPMATAKVVCQTLNDWLDAPEDEVACAPVRGAAFIEQLRETVYLSLDPEVTVVERTKRRLRLAGPLAGRFDADYTGDHHTGDPLEQVMSAPEFKQAMCEPLRDIAHERLLPGVEKVPQNTVGLLLSNRRFIESYMSGLVHEFAGELLWRGYPTDQRGTYFRQFWDVSGYVPISAEHLDLLNKWRADFNRRTGLTITSMGELPHRDKERILRNNRATVAVELPRLLDRLLRDWIEEEGVATREDLSEDRKEVLTSLESLHQKLKKNHPEAFSALSDQAIAAFDDLVAELVAKEQLAEKLKDIEPLTGWQEHPLGSNPNEIVAANSNDERPVENVVMLVRGDLLKRYPNTIIYAIDAVHCDGYDGELVPALPEYLNPTDDTGNPIIVPDEITERINGIIGDIKPVYPLFRATLPPDISFFGFPFDDDVARGMGTELGKFFILEQPMSEPVFGADSKAGSDYSSWDDLAWSHFGFEDDEYGKYVDAGNNPPPPNNDQGLVWSECSSSATRASITFQKPVRIAMHAKEMFPNVAAYFELMSDASSDKFVFKLTDPEKIALARAFVSEAETVRTTVRGVIVMEMAQYNPDWSFHLDPHSIVFCDPEEGEADVSIDYIESHFADVGRLILPGNVWCPSNLYITREVSFE